MHLLQGITKSRKGGRKPPFLSDPINAVLCNACLPDERPPWGAAVMVAQTNAGIPSNR
jgi:hypothetical protein